LRFKGKGLGGIACITGEKQRLADGGHFTVVLLKIGWFWRKLRPGARKRYSTSFMIKVRDPDFCVRLRYG
jgi:hypothetical protein